MKISRKAQEQLLNRADIVTVVRHYLRDGLQKNREWITYGKGTEFVAICPFHSERTPSFTVARHKQFYHCFGCGAHGDAISFVMEYEGLSYGRACCKVARICSISLRSIGLYLSATSKKGLARARRRDRKKTRKSKSIRRPAQRESPTPVWNDNDIPF